ncbi:MAG: hypothetical protein WDO72_05890 [Pseudomonadota bacterium]
MTNGTAGEFYLTRLWLRFKSWLLQPVTNVEQRIHAVEERIEVLEKQALLALRQWLQAMLRQLVLGGVAAVLALIGAVYALMGLWLGASALLGTTRASFVLGALFVLASLVPFTMLRRLRRRA